MTPIQLLSSSQVDLLVVLAFEHVAVSQATMLRQLPPSWQRAYLQQVLAELIEEGWVEQIASGWRVPPRLQERVARFAWRNRTLDLRSASREPGPHSEGQLRLALYAGDIEGFLLHWKFRAADFWSPFDPEWLDWIEAPIAELILERRILSGQPLSAEEIHYLESRPDLLTGPAGREVAWAALLAGRQLMSAPAFAAFAQMQRGNAPEALRLYASAPRVAGELGWLELLARMEVGPWSSVEEWLAATQEPILQAIGQMGRGETPFAVPWRPGQGLRGLLAALLLAWQGESLSQWEEERQRLQVAGQFWLAAEYASFLGDSDAHRRLGTRSLLAALQSLAPWKQALDALEGLRHPHQSLRMVWRVSVFAEGEGLTVEAVEQRRGPKGWTQGRPVALSRLAKDWPQRDYLDDWDRKICRRTGLEPDLLAEMLVGHPRVMHRDTGHFLAVRAVRPRLKVSFRGENWWLAVEASPRYSLRESRLEVLLCTTGELALQAAVGEGLLVPPAGQARWRELLRGLDILGFDM